jgi:uncharacterized protein
VSQSHDPHHPDEHPTRRAERWARIRRVKQMLKFMPRRAVLHKYPIVGRFAEMARKRAYLWSLKPESMRPALYAGSILSLMPVMGAQIPIALVLSVLLRANFMVLGGLQFITNPFTAAPIYLATHQLGSYVIQHVGFGEAPTSANPNESLLPLSEHHEIGSPGSAPTPKAPGRVRRIATAFNALILGGLISGAALGTLLDILYRNYWQHHTHAPPKLPASKRKHSPP